MAPVREQAAAHRPAVQLEAADCIHSVPRSGRLGAPDPLRWLREHRCGNSIRPRDRSLRVLRASATRRRFPELRPLPLQWPLPCPNRRPPRPPLLDRSSRRSLPHLAHRLSGPYGPRTVFVWAVVGRLRRSARSTVRLIWIRPKPVRLYLLAIRGRKVFARVAPPPLHPPRSVRLA